MSTSFTYPDPKSYSLTLVSSSTTWRVRYTLKMPFEYPDGTQYLIQKGELDFKNWEAAIKAAIRVSKSSPFIDGKVTVSKVHYRYHTVN